MSHLRVFLGFTSASDHTLEEIAIRGSTGYSDWSDPVSHMSM